jgi:hypothetical protein
MDLPVDIFSHWSRYSDHLGERNEQHAHENPDYSKSTYQFHRNEVVFPNLK